MFERALATYDAVAPEDRALLTYLVGELWRRVGDTKRARKWFDLVSGEVTSQPRDGWILEAARQQRDEPEEWFETL